MHAAIADKKEELAELCRRHDVIRLEVFGSAARGADFDPLTGDVDLLVEFRLDDGRAPLRQYFDFAEALHQALGNSIGARANDLHVVPLSQPVQDRRGHRRDTGGGPAPLEVHPEGA